MSDESIHSDIFPQHRKQADELLLNIITKHDELATLLEEVSGKWGYDGVMYRFYSQSFKVYRVQYSTQKIIAALRSIAPEGTTFNTFFEEIINAGASGKEFDLSHNEEWTLHTRPIIEAFFHARYFLNVAVKTVKELETSKELHGFGWWALLGLYDLWVD